MTTAYDFQASAANGDTVNLEDYRGRVLLDREYRIEMWFHTTV